jgi:hypothetical protein
MPNHDENLDKRDSWPTGSVRIARFRKWCAMRTLLSQILRFGDEALAALMEKKYPSEKIWEEGVELSYQHVLKS